MLLEMPQVSGLTTAQCISLLREYLRNIEAGHPEAPLRNPASNRRISTNNATFQQLLRTCRSQNDPELSAIIASLDARRPQTAQPVPQPTPVAATGSRPASRTTAARATAPAPAQQAPATARAAAPAPAPARQAPATNIIPPEPDWPRDSIPREQLEELRQRALSVNFTFTQFERERVNYQFSLPSRNETYLHKSYVARRMSQLSSFNSRVMGRSNRRFADTYHLPGSILRTPLLTIPRVAYFVSKCMSLTTVKLDQYRPDERRNNILIALGEYLKPYVEMLDVDGPYAMIRKNCEMFRSDTILSIPLDRRIGLYNAITYFNGNDAFTVERQIRNTEDADYYAELSRRRIAARQRLRQEAALQAAEIQQVANVPQFVETQTLTFSRPRGQARQAANAAQQAQEALPTPQRSPDVTDSPVNESATDFLAECAEAFSGLPPPFTGLGNKLAKTCNKISHRGACSLNNINALYDVLKNTYVRDSHTMSFNTIRGQEFSKLLKTIWNRSDEAIESGFKSFVGLHRINYQGEITMGLGPRREVFQSVANQLFKSNTGLFKATNDTSNRFLINSEFDLAAFFRRTGISAAATTENRKKLYKIVGSLLAFLLINQIKPDAHLSHYIQARILYREDELRPSDILMYYLLDFPEDRPGRINLFKIPDQIAALAMDFNDEMELDPSRANEPLTQENYGEYTYLIARKKLRLDESEEDLKALLDGFFISRKTLRRRNVTLPILDTLMSGREITVEEMEKVVNKVRTAADNAGSDWNKPPYSERKTPLNWFIEILRDTGRLFPTRVAAEQPNRYAQNAAEFKKQLLYWWSGSQYINENFNYTVLPSGGTGQYFRVHTCFTLINFPPRIETRQAMYEQLLRQIADTQYTMA